MSHRGKDNVKGNNSRGSSDYDLEAYSDCKETSPAKQLAHKKKVLITNFLNDVGKEVKGKRVLNVAFIGTPGAGKSSAINTCIAAFSETKYKEFARAGRFNAVRQVTCSVESFKKERYIPERKDYCMPTFIDIAGFNDEDTDLTEELLRIVLSGCLPQKETLMDAKEYFDKHGIIGLRKKYKHANNSVKVDRIVFVASAEETVPENLIKRVVAVAHPTGGMSARNKKTIPMFGVMCKVDRVKRDEEEFLEREKKFIGCLGLTGSEHRYTRLVNYCNDVDKDKKRMDAVFPELDVPALEFLQQVCASWFNEERKEPYTTSKQVTMLLLLKGILIAVLLYMITTTMIEERVKNICSIYGTVKDPKKRILGLDKFCNVKNDIENLSMFALVPYTILFLVGDFLIPKIIQKIMNRNVEI